jgi:hypothetical protein
MSAGVIRRIAAPIAIGCSASQDWGWLTQGGAGAMPITAAIAMPTGFDNIAIERSSRAATPMIMPRNV